MRGPYETSSNSIELSIKSVFGEIRSTGPDQGLCEFLDQFQLLIPCSPPPQIKSSIRSFTYLVSKYVSV